MKVLIIALLYLFTANYATAEKYSNHKYLEIFRLEYLNNSKDNTEIKKKVSKLLEEINLIVSKTSGFKDPGTLKKALHECYKLSNDRYIKEYLYQFMRDHKLTDLSVSMNHSKLKNEFQPELYSSLSRLYISSIYYNLQVSGSILNKTKNPKEIKRFFKDIEEAMKLKKLNVNDLNYISYAIDSFVSQGIRIEKKLPENFLDTLNKNLNEYHPFLAGFLKLKLNYYLKIPEPEKAKQHLETAYLEGERLYKNHPKAFLLAFQMMFHSVKMKKSYQTVEKWFNICSALHPSNHAIYDRYLFLVHKYYDDRNNHEIFKKCSESGYDTLIPSVLLNHAFHMTYSHYQGKYSPNLEFYNDYLHEMFKGYEDLNDQGKQIFHHKYYFHERHFVFAAKLKKYKHVLILNQRYGKHLKDSYFIKSQQVNYDDSIAEAKLKLSNVAGIFSDIDSTFKQKKSLDTVQEIKNLKEEINFFATANPDEHLQVRFKTYLSLLTEKEKYISYKKIPLKIDSTLSHWRDKEGNIKAVSAQRLTMDTYGYKDKKQKAFYINKFEPPYTFSIGFNLPGGNRLEVPAQMGILIGDVYNQKQGISFWVDRSKKIYGIYANGAKLLEKNRKFPPLVNVSVKVTTEGKCLFYIGKKKIFEYKAENIDLSTIGLGVPPWTEASDMILFQSPCIIRTKKIASDKI